MRKFEMMAAGKGKRLPPMFAILPEGAEQAFEQMFQRLEYVYCGSECVQKHKRELMAAAAMARFGN
jgi:hypothetical protein